MYEERDLVLQVKNFIPCDTCKTEWYDPAPEENLLNWSRELHNKVNMKLGRYAKWDAVDLNITHKPHCDICEEKEFIHRFPWVFIHEVAKQPNSMDFLKEFNAKYPCEKHRGKILDEPQPDEETLAWTVRNHQKVDPSFNMYQVIGTPVGVDPLTGLPIQSSLGTVCSSCPAAPLTDALPSIPS